MREIPDCTGPAFDINNALKIRKDNFTSAPATGKLVWPNPMEAAQNLNALITDSAVRNALRNFSLLDLVNPAILDQAFLKVRWKTVSDTPLGATNGVLFSFAPETAQYSQVMAYYSVWKVLKYVESLGFTFPKSRNFFVLVETQDSRTASDYVDAFYNHNVFSPSSPRLMTLYGNGPFAPAKDNMIFLHETMHFINESLSQELMDYAGNFTSQTQGGVLHECLADALAESLEDRASIAPWFNRNFTNVPGTPLRKASRENDEFSSYDSVFTNTPTKRYPKKYVAAEWCTRVLWQIRSNFVKENESLGALLSDRLLLKAVSQLNKDASIEDFRTQLLNVDENYYCGLHQRSIQRSFESYGYRAQATALTKPLGFTPRAIGVTDETGTESFLAFEFSITNPNSIPAKNITVKLESLSAQLVPTRYLIWFGNLAAGQTLRVLNSTTEPFNLDYSVLGSIPSNPSQVRYRLTLQVDNGAPQVVEGVYP